MRMLLDGLHDMMADFGSLGAFAKSAAKTHQTVEVLSALSAFFYELGIKGMVPSPKSSVAKRPCMFLRWMVRFDSPVDMGVWSDIISKQDLLIPLDTHVYSMALSLGLTDRKQEDMVTAIEITDKFRQVFPNDPSKGDFALFGYGINN